MINSTSTGQPTFSFLKCDNYPYYIPSIKGISYLSAPISTGVKVDVGSDEILCVLSGSLHMEVFPSFTKDDVVYNASKNDIFYFTCGMQKYKVIEASDDCEVLQICFNLYTCSDLNTSSSVMDFGKALNSPISHRRMFTVLPTFSHFNYGDEMHTHISQIMEYRTMKNPGYVIQVQTHLLQLLLCISKTTDNYTDVLSNINVIGISSKFNPFTVMLKGCKLSISDVTIYNMNPHSKKTSAKVLSNFKSHRICVLNPKDNSLTASPNHNGEFDMDFIEISASTDTIYHIWLYNDHNHFINDLRPYAECAYLRFYAKCNMQTQFGIVVYNHNTHQCINHTFSIEPSKTFIEYCVPLISSNNQENYNPYINKIINYIKQNYEEKITVDDIAKYIHMNNSYISTSFKEKMGISISEYILNYRLSVAKNLLISSPESSISEIAHFTGFYDSSHFSKAFKQSFGITAKEFRQEGYKNPHI